jgi:putative (di)nucleoside polyphosphate hydrolase
MIKKEELPLRIGVGIVLLNNKNKIFVGKRIDNPKKFWQMPQGGVDKNEDLFQAAKRELQEETSITSIKLIKKLDGWLEYNLPQNLLGKIWKGKYKGQKQKWFIMKFLGDDMEINVKTKHPEFFEWKWVDPDEITDFVVNFKLDVYKKIKEKVKIIINSEI